MIPVMLVLVASVGIGSASMGCISVAAVVHSEAAVEQQQRRELSGGPCVIEHRMTQLQHKDGPRQEQRAVCQWLV